MMNNKIITVGLIGLGEVSQLMHIPILRKLDSMFTIHGVFDVSHSLKTYIAAKNNCIAFNSVEELIQCDEIDCVFILSPDQYHFEHAMLALKNNKHMFIEKPVCLRKEELEILHAELVNTSKNTVAMVGYMRRYAQSFIEARNEIATMDTINHVYIHDIICEGPFFIRQSNRVFYPNDIADDIIKDGRDKLALSLEKVCGANASPSIKRAYQVLTGLSAHSLSAMRELLGMPNAVSSVQIKKGGESLVIIFDYDTYNVVYDALIDDVVRFDAQIQVLAQNKSVKVKYDTPYIRNLPMTVEVVESTENTTSTKLLGPCYKDAFEIELETLYNAIINNTTYKTSLSDSLEDFEIFQMIVNKIGEK